jgi:hypothetical protein
MNAAVLATLVAAVVGTGHYATHRYFGDEVYFSKAGVSKAGVVVTGLAWFGTYIAAGGAAAAIFAPAEAFFKGLGQTVDALIGGGP